MRLQKALPRKKVVERVWFSKDVKEGILRKSDGVCAHCGCPVAIGDNFTVEHVVPISKGGTNDLVNIVALCQTCNTTKGDCVWHPYEYLTYLHDENKKELGEYIDKYFHDKRWFTRNNFCQVDFKKIEVNIPFAGKQKTLRRGDQTLLARRCMTVNYKLQKALYYDLQDIYDMQISYMKRNKLKVDKAAIKETISNAFLNGAIYYVARSDGTKVGSFAVRMEERHIAIGHCKYTTPILVYSNIITASSLQYVCEAVRDGMEFIQQQYALVLGVDGVVLVAIEMDSDSTVARLVLNTWTCLSTQVSDHLITTFSLHRFYKPGSDDSKQSLVTPSELLNVIKRMQIIGEEVL